MVLCSLIFTPLDNAQFEQDCPSAFRAAFIASVFLFAVQVRYQVIVTEVQVMLVGGVLDKSKKIYILSNHILQSLHVLCLIVFENASYIRKYRFTVYQTSNAPNRGCRDQLGAYRKLLIAKLSCNGCR